MPVSLSVYPDRGLVYSVFRGEVTEEEFRARAEAIRLHPDFDSRFSEILDLRSVTGLRTSTQTLKQLAEHDGLFDSNSRHVVIAPAGMLHRISRIFEAAGEESSPRFRVVKTPEEAFHYCEQSSATIAFGAIRPLA